MREDFSIIICTRNRALELTNTLRSIELQTVKPLEIIIVDASETNQSETIIDMKISGLIYIHYIQFPSSTRQRNVAIKQANGNYVLFLDDDVVLEPDYLFMLREFIKQNPSVIAISGFVTNDIKGIKRIIRNIFYFLFYGNTRTQIKPGIGPTLFPKSNKIVFTKRLSSCNMAVRKDIIINKNINFDESLLGYTIVDDVDFSYRLSHHGDLVYLPKTRLQHLKSPKNRLQIHKMSALKVNNWTYLTAKHFPRTRKNVMLYRWSLLGVLVEYFGYLLIGRAIWDKEILALIVSRLRSW